MTDLSRVRRRDLICYQQVGVPSAVLSLQGESILDGCVPGNVRSAQKEIELMPWPLDE